MYSIVKNRFGAPGLIAVVALVFAMFGGAYAATRTAHSSKAKPLTKAQVLALIQKNEVPGPAGPAGLQGPAGPKGDTGSPGANGVSPAGAEFSGSKSGHCTEGGVEFKGADATFACNGKEGSPWAAGGMLPSGASESGVWAVATDSQTGQAAAISFDLPLAAAPTIELLEEGYSGTPTSNCPGSLSNPTAKKGFLCVYAQVDILEFFDSTCCTTSFPSGAILGFGGLEENEFNGVAKGTWAVTAP